MRTFNEFMEKKEVNYDILEVLSEIEHDQWMAWAKSLMESEDLSEDRIKRWKTMMVPYDKLPEDIKDYDREYAQKVIDALSTINEGIASKEIFVQGTALRMLSKGRDDVVMKLIEIYGTDFRDIINDFQSRLGRLPTADDLIWVAGVKTGKDPRKVAKMLMKELEV